MQILIPFRNKVNDKKKDKVLEERVKLLYLTNSLLF